MRTFDPHPDYPFIFILGRRGHQHRTCTCRAEKMGFSNDSVAQTINIRHAETVARARLRYWYEKDGEKGKE